MITAPVHGCRHSRSGARSSGTTQRQVRVSRREPPTTPGTSASRHRTASRAAEPPASSSTSSSSPEDDSDSVSEMEFTQSSSVSSDSEPEVPDAGEKWVSKSGVSWEPTAAKTLRFIPAAHLHEGPTLYAIRRIHDLQSCMDLFLTEEIIQLVLDSTNRHGRETNGDSWAAVTLTELRAFLGLLILAGVYRSRSESTKSLWSEGTGRAIFPATMTRQMFEKIAATIRFDDKQSRSRRLQNKKLAAIWPLWERWAPRLQLLYNPGVEICVDEQLVPFKGRCQFRQYIPNKPARYGIKVWVACDARTSYAWRMAVYTGKPEGAAQEVGQGKRIVLELVEGLKGHTVTCDNFFTSFSLGEELLQQNIAMVGTIRRNKPELPPELLEVRQRAPLSSLFAFTQTHTAVSYVPRRGKNVLLMSTKHRQPAISDAEHRKPVIILDYNKNKGAVDNLDKVVATYSCRRRTHRWPLKMFYNILDVSAFNSFVLWTCVHPQWKGGTTHKRRLFLEELGRALVTPLMLQRKRLPRNLSALAAVNTARAEQLEAKTEERGSPPTAVVRRQCHLCRKRIRNTCAGCGTRICRDHTKMLCSTCWS